MVTNVYFDRATFEDNIRAFVSKGSGIQSNYVIPGNDNGPRPQRLHATVLLIDDEKVGESNRHWTRVFDADGNVQGYELWQRDNHRAAYSIQFFGAGARAAAERFFAWAESEFALEDASLLKFSLWDLSKIRQIDTLVTDAWEERVGIDGVFMYWYDSRYTPGIVDTVPLSAFVDTMPGEYRDQFEITGGSS